MNRAIIKPTIALTIMALCAALFIGMVYSVTEEPIRNRRAQAAAEAVSLLIPATYETTYEYINKVDSSLTQRVTAYDRVGNVLGYVFTANPAGYSGRIHMMVAICPLGAIIGVHVLHHTETPGLGSNITRESFLAGFVGLDHGVITQADVPIITSATISVNAVLRGVNDAKAYFVSQLLEK